MKKIRISYWIVIALMVFPLFCFSQTNLKSPGTYYHFPKLKKGYEDVEMAKAKISELAKANRFKQVHDLRNNNSFNYKEIVFLFDRLEVIKGNHKIRLDYVDWADNHRVYLEEKYLTPAYSFYSAVIGNALKIELSNISYLKAIEITQHLYSLQYYFLSIKLDKKLDEFKPIAEQYKNDTNKPTMSEEQRKFIVQANAMNQQKQYVKAIQLFVQAIKLDAVSYPAAYANIALLQAQLGNYDLAIYHMKKYLMLEPNASDSRASQDKMYEWEIMMKE